MEGGKPSPSMRALTPLPKGEARVVLFVYVLQQKTLPKGEPSVQFFVYVHITNRVLFDKKISAHRIGEHF